MFLWVCRAKAQRQILLACDSLDGFVKRSQSDSGPLPPTCLPVAVLVFATLSRVVASLPAAKQLSGSAPGAAVSPSPNSQIVLI